MSYLRFIDGLRAFAILPVLLFHLSPSLMPGGYLGVDVFFVISGFLITGVLVKQADQGPLALIGFWERRVRRLLPASIAVMLASFVAALVFMSLEEAKVLGASLVAAALFHANLFFADTLDYFAAPAAEHPLLHFWSLAVEEQFYFIWPFVIAVSFLLMRVRKTRLVLTASLIALASLASLALLLFAPEAKPGNHFFFLSTRVWELGVGSLLALYLAGNPQQEAQQGTQQDPNQTPPAPLLAELAAGLGAACVLISLAILSEDHRLPGLASIPLVVGTAAILGVGLRYQTRIIKLLCWRGFVWVGLLSYSLYLWHWPIFSFARIATGGLPSVWIWPLLLALTFAISYLSWRYLEQPIRRWKGASTLPRQLAVIAAGLAALLIVVGLGRALVVFDGMPWRLSGLDRQIYQQQASENPYRERCDSWQNAQNNNDFCTLGRAYDPQHGFDAIVVGSSFADQHVPGLKLWAEQHDISLRQVTNSTCAGVPQIIGRDPSKVQVCTDYHEALLKVIDSNPNLKLIILATHFRFLPDFPAQLAAQHQRSQALADYAKLLAERGIDLHIIAPIQIRMNLRAACIKPAVRDGELAARCGREKSPRLSQTEDYYSGVAQRFDNVSLSLPSTWLCPNDFCRLVADGMLLYRNQGHINAYGARWLVPKLGLPALARD